MSSGIKKIFSTDISRYQARDTGMALVLILLIIGLLLEDLLYIKIATITLIVSMTIPLFFKYVAVLWLGFSHLVGQVVSKVLLSLIFYLVLTPVGLIRKLLGYDSLKLKQFKKSTESVMQFRNITFTNNDIDKPY